MAGCCGRCMATFLPANVAEMAAAWRVGANRNTVGALRLAKQLAGEYSCSERHALDGAWKQNAFNSPQRHSFCKANVAKWRRWLCMKTENRMLLCACKQKMLTARKWRNGGKQCISAAATYAALRLAASACRRRHMTRIVARRREASLGVARPEEINVTAAGLASVMRKYRLYQLRYQKPMALRRRSKSASGRRENHELPPLTSCLKRRHKLGYSKAPQ